MAPKIRDGIEFQQLAPKALDQGAKRPCNHFIEQAKHILTIDADQLLASPFGETTSVSAPNTCANCLRMASW